MFPTSQPDMASTYNSHAPLPFPSTQTGQSRITYFMTRNNGLPVPLIPADELPFTIKLQNVPRVLNPEQTYGLQYVGNAAYTGCTFKLEREGTAAAVIGASMQRSTSQPPNEIAHARTQSSNGKQFLAPDAFARQTFASNPISSSSFAYSNTLAKRPISAAEAAKSWRRTDPLLQPPTTIATTGTSDATQSVIGAILNSTPGAETAERIGYRSHNSSPPPSGVIPDQERKEYCTHWILQGWCAYEQQGCRYKHEMLDKEGLTKIGIRHVPRWWQERNAPIKLGGDRTALVGPLVKPEEWLKMRKGSDADSERSFTTSGTEGGSVSTEASSEEEEKVVPVKEEKKIFKKIETVKEEKKVPATRSPIPVQAETDRLRKSSSGSDLIKFAPLLPTPSSSTTSISSMAVNIPDPIQILKRTVKPQDALQKAELPKKVETATKTPTKTTKIFVPAGESPEEHIAQAKKRERVVRSKTARTPSPVEAEKPKPEASSSKVQDTKPAGLSASRWAGPATKTDEKEARKLTKSGCRPRRPASSSPIAKARGTVEKK